MPTAAPKKQKTSTAAIIVNPASAGGATSRHWPAISQELRNVGFAHRAVLTTAPGDATVLTREVLEAGCETVVAVGGDGTLSEVVNGFFDEKGKPINVKATLGMIPSGTGGDFRKSVGISNNSDEAIKQLQARSIRHVDVGRVDFADGSHHFFINIADCGIGGEVVTRVNRSSNKGGGLRGTAVFLWTSLSELMTYPGAELRVEVDGLVAEGLFRNVVIANGRYFGGGMKIAPKAEVDDGLFDVVVIKSGSKLSALTGIPALYRGSHLSRGDVEFLRGKKIKIEYQGKRPVLFDLEGEQIGQAPATITCLPGVLPVVVA